MSNRTSLQVEPFPNIFHGLQRPIPYLPLATRSRVSFNLGDHVGCPYIIERVNQGNMTLVG